MRSDEVRSAATATSTPRFGRGEFIVYLDVDGVVHPEDTKTRLKTGAYIASPPGHMLFEHVPLLEQLLAPYPSVKIVLSTSWVRVYRYSRVVKRFPQSLRARMIGATYHRAMDENAFLSLSRGQQVWSDVVRRRPRDWIALDDDCDWPEWCRSHHIPTHPVLGISEPSVRGEVARRLRACSVS